MAKKEKHRLHLRNDHREFTYDCSMGSRQCHSGSIKVLNQSWEPVYMDIVD